MRQFLILILSIVSLMIFSSLNERSENLHSIVLVDDNCDSIPQINLLILDYAESKLKSRVGSGQCWDFPAAALNYVNAQWDGMMNFGIMINPEKECIYPGDIIQFEGVEVDYSENGNRTIEFMGPHTAIIYKVYSQNRIDLIHQNFGRSAKKVGVTDLDFRNVTKGKFTIYRPIAYK